MENFVQQMYDATKNALDKPTILTVTILDKMLWKYHKEVAYKLGIPTNVGQWFRTLIDKDSKFEYQRDAVETLLAVVKYGTTNEAKASVKDSYIESLHTLESLLAEKLAEATNNEVAEDTI